MNLPMMLLLATQSASADLGEVTLLEAMSERPVLALANRSRKKVSAPVVDDNTDVEQTKEETIATTEKSDILPIAEVLEPSEEEAAIYARLFGPENETAKPEQAATSVPVVPVVAQIQEQPFNPPAVEPTVEVAPIAAPIQSTMVGAALPPGSDTIPWWIWPLGLAGVAFAWSTRGRTKTRRQRKTPLELKGKLSLGKDNSLAIVEANDGNGGTRTLLIGVGGGAPQLVLDFAQGGPVLEANAAEDELIHLEQGARLPSDETAQQLERAWKTASALGHQIPNSVHLAELSEPEEAPRPRRRGASAYATEANFLDEEPPVQPQHGQRRVVKGEFGGRSSKQNIPTRDDFEDVLAEREDLIADVLAERARNKNRLRVVGGKNSNKTNQNGDGVDRGTQRGRFV